MLIPIQIENDVVLVRQEATAFAARMGFDEYACSQIALGVSEIAQNVIRHAQNGNALITSKANNRVLQIKITDQGPGFTDIEQATQEGFSTKKNSLGIGLSVAERAFDAIKIQSSPEEGSIVILEKYLPFPSEIVTYGSVSLKDDRYLINGDAFFIKEYDGDKILLTVIDGAGQGKSAHYISIIVKSIVEKNFNAPLEKIVLAADQALRSSPTEGGATIAIARIFKDTLEYIGIGDTHSYIYTQSGVVALKNRDGRLGEFQLPRLSVTTYSLSQANYVILCTDGINTHVAEKLQDMETSAQNMANYIFNTYHRLYGDATVLISYYKPYAI